MGGRIKTALGVDTRCTGLAVPKFELRQVTRQVGLRVGISNGLSKVVTGDGLPIVALKVQRHALRKAVAADQGLHHAHHFGAFFVHGHGIKVVDFQVAVGPYGVRHGPCVFRKLGGAQHPNVFNAFHRSGRWAARQVLAELLVSKNRKPFFKAELKPVATRDAVARPVVKILVTHHAFNVGVIGVGGSGRVGQHKLGIEDVEALVFHGPHIEVAGGHHHEALQVQRQAKAGFVPSHRRHERIHGVFGFVEVARAYINLQCVFFACARHNALLARHQFARH